MALGASTEKIRYFESARGFIALDELLRAYSDTTGVSLLDIIEEAKANLKKNGSPS